jgi:hypothetical protein
MEIRFAEDGDLEAMIRFNHRLRAGGREEQMTLQPSQPGEARYRPAGFPVYHRMMIAEDGREIRAAMMLYHHNVFIPLTIPATLGSGCVETARKRMSDGWSSRVSG